MWWHRACQYRGRRDTLVQRRNLVIIGGFAVMRGPSGEVDERLKSHAWKACIGSNLSGVRIPLSPPEHCPDLFRYVKKPAFLMEIVGFFRPMRSG